MERSEELDLGFAIDGARLAGSLPYIEASLDKAMQAVTTRMDVAFTQNTLTPEMAFAAWIELLSYRRLLRRLQQQVRIGVAAGQRQKELLNTATRASELDILPLPRV